MKAYNVDDFVTLIGIDWADKKHDICEHPTHSDKYNYSVIKNKPEAYMTGQWSLKIAIQTKK